MAESVFNQMWNTLSTYNFEINNDVNINVMCKICKKIMIDPYAASCGCRFCLTCIIKYIGNGRKFCPGENEECTEEYLVIGANVHKDLLTRRNISNIIIKCPNASCMFKEKLQNIGDHIRICTLKPLECPYEALGCVNKRLKEESLKEHLNSDELRHSQLLIEAFNELRNDINEVKYIVELKEKEIKELKTETAKNQKEIEEVKENGRKKEILISKEIDELKNEIRILKEKEKRIESDNSDMKREKMSIRKELNILKKSVENMKDKKINEPKIEIEVESNPKIKEITKEIEKIKAAIINFKKNEEKVEHKKDSLSVEKEDETKKIKNCKDEIEEMKTTLKLFCLGIKEDFVWTFENLLDNSQFNEGVYLTDTFYKDDYRLCLQAKIGRDIFNYGFIYVSVIIMKGDKDEKLQWPMKRTITISLFNHDTLKIHESWRINYDKCKDKVLFTKPKADMNEPIDCAGIFMRNIIDVPGLIKNNSVIIGCSLSSKQSLK